MCESSMQTHNDANGIDDRCFPIFVRAKLQQIIYLRQGEYAQMTGCIYADIQISLEGERSSLNMYFINYCLVTLAQFLTQKQTISGIKNMPLSLTWE